MEERRNVGEKIQKSLILRDFLEGSREKAQRRDRN